MFDVSEDIFAKDKEESNEDRLKRLHSEADKIFKICSEAPNDIFPDFLFKVEVNTFEDEDDDAYIRKAYGFSPMAESVRMLKRKYSDYYDWVDAMYVYDDYMEYLAAKYGSRKNAKHGIKNGYYFDYLPKKPKLKGKKKNKKLLDIGVPLSREGNGWKPKGEELDELINTMYPPLAPDDPFWDLDFEKEFVYEPDEVPDYLRKGIKKDFEKQERAYRKRNIYKHKADVIFTVEATNFLQSFDPDDPLSVIKKDSDEAKYGPSLEDYVEEMHRWDYYSEDLKRILIEEETSTDYEIINGTIVNKSSSQDIEIMAMLYKAGFNIDNSVKNIGKSGVKLLKRATGNSYVQPLSKKKQKKQKKKQKKKYKEAQKRMEADERMNALLIENRQEFFRDANEVSFRLADLYGEEL